MIKSTKIIKIILVCVMAMTCICSRTTIAEASNRMNLAFHKPATSSYQDSDAHGAEKVVDGDLNTRWGTDPHGSNQWIKVDLLNAFEIDEFYIASENSNAQKIRKYKIEGSLDDVSYQLIHQSADKPEGFDLEHTVKLEQAVTYQYIKITVESLIAQAYPSISLREFGVIGEGGDIGDVENALADLVIPTKVYRDFELPSANEELGVQYTWTSNDDTIEIKDGNAIVHASDTQKTVSLTVDARKNEYSQSKRFEVQVMPAIVNDYKLYPTPQSVAYGTKSMVMTTDVNVVLSGEVDENIQQYLKRVMKTFQLKPKFSDDIDNTMVNVVLGKQDANSHLLNDCFKDVTYDKELADSIEGYVLAVSESKRVIAIMGKDDAGVFNGLFTLKQMFDSSSSALKEVVIADAPDTKFRGVIEGFYGTYSHKERLDLLEYIGQLKMNTYIYGSKSDEFHYGKWRELYPETQIKELEELVVRGKQNNVEVIWSAHVGGHINMSSEADYQALIAKFDQLYNIGVRQFGIFYDDAGTDNTYLTDFVNRVNREYIGKKEGLKDLIICPQEYNKRAASDGYLSKLAAFDANVQVMWTGDSVISEVSPEMMDYIEKKIKRPAYIWWNYPVNDLGMGDQLLVGETVGLSKEMGKMNGLVSNPMLQWQASKFSVFSIADYCWNIEGFNRHQSWKDGINYNIPEKEYAEAFQYFSANNNQSLFELKNQAVESAYLINQFDVFKQDYYLGKDIDKEAAAIKEEFKKIEDACELLKTYKGNPELVSQIMSWLNSMQKVTQAGQLIMDNILYMNAHDLSQKDVVEQVYTNFLNCQKAIQSIGGKASGRRVLVPFIQEMQSAMQNTLSQHLGNSNKVATLTNYRNGAFTTLDLSKMVDGDETTAVTFEDDETTGHWYGLDLGKMTKINTLEILIGADENDQNVAKAFKIQISYDGIHWQDIQTTINKNTIRNKDQENAKFIRYYVEEGSQKRAKVREFSVNKVNKTVITNVAEYSQIFVTENKGNYSINGIENFTLKTNEYIGIQFDKVKEFANIQTNVEGLQLQYSTDGKAWTTFQGEIFTAKYVRIVNDTEELFRGSLENFSVQEPEKYTPKKMVITRSNDMAIWSGNEKDIIDGNRDTLCWTKEQKIGQQYVIAFEEETPIKDVRVVMISGDVMEGGVVEISNNNSDWEAIGNITSADKEKLIEVSGDKVARYLRVRVTKNSSNWLKINEIEINKKANQAEIPLLDNEAAKAMIDTDIKTGYAGNNSGGEVIYYNMNTPFAQSIGLYKDAASLVKIEGLFEGTWKEIVKGQSAYLAADFSTLGNATQFKISWQAGTNIMLYEFSANEVTKQDVIDKEILKEAIEKASVLIENTYTPESWEVFIHALEAAQAVYADEAASQKTIDETTNLLNSAMEQLIEDTAFIKTILKSAIDKATAAEASGQLEKLAPIVKELIILKRNQALEVYNDVKSTNKLCLEAWMDLANALHYLDFTADKAALLDLITACKEINTDEYIGGVAEFKVALEAAQKVYDNANALQISIDKAFDDLELAKDNLVLKDIVNKAPLAAMIANIEAKVGNGENYKKDTNWTAFEKARADAQAVLANKDATQADVIKAMTALAAAYEDIRLLPSEEQLEQLKSFINIVSKLNRKMFTKEQLQQIDETTTKAVAMLADFDDKAFVSVEKELAGVLNMINNMKPTTPEESVNRGNSSLPNTGDTTQIIGILCLLFMSGCGFIVMKRRNKA